MYTKLWYSRQFGYREQRLVRIVEDMNELCKTPVSVEMCLQLLPHQHVSIDTLVMAPEY